MTNMTEKQESRMLSLLTASVMQASIGTAKPDEIAKCADRIESMIGTEKPEDRELKTWSLLVGSTMRLSMGRIKQEETKGGDFFEVFTKLAKDAESILGTGKQEDQELKRWSYFVGSMVQLCAGTMDGANPEDFYNIAEFAQKYIGQD